jgi:hypothetical protein
MNEKNIRIGGRVFDLTNPDEKKAAIRAWLQAKAAQKTPGEKVVSPLSMKGFPQSRPEDPSASDG